MSLRGKSSDMLMPWPLEAAIVLVFVVSGNVWAVDSYRFGAGMVGVPWWLGTAIGGLAWAVCLGLRWALIQTLRRHDQKVASRRRP